jgi:hypothetical protein
LQAKVEMLRCQAGRTRLVEVEGIDGWQFDEAFTCKWLYPRSLTYYQDPHA